MEKRYPTWIKATTLLAGIILGYVVLTHGKFILMPLAFATLLAMLLEPLSQQIERLKVGRIASIILSMTVVFVVLSGIFSLLSIQFVQFADQLPDANEKIRSLTEDIRAFFESTFGIAPEQQIEYLQRGLENIIDRSGDYAGSALGATTSVFTTLSILPIFVFFLMYHKNMYHTFLNKVWEGSNEAIDSIADSVQRVTQNYIVGLITIIGILGALNAFGLWIIGLDHALFFAGFAAVLAIIPYIGIILGSLPAIFYALLFTDSLLMPLGVIGVFAAVQFLEGNFITPNVIGAKVSINPFVAFLALLLGAEIWGIAGMILFVPFIGILRSILNEIPGLQPYAYLLGNKIEYGESVSIQEKESKE